MTLLSESYEYLDEPYSGRKFTAVFFDIPKISRYGTRTVTVRPYTVAYGDGAQP